MIALVLRAAVAGALIGAGLAAACAAAPPSAAAVDTRHDTCAHCRMPVSEARLAAQIVAPGEEPRFFDDIGCLRDYLQKSGRPHDAAAGFVADYRTSRWIPVGDAAYLRNDGIDTPMGSHLVAFATPSARDGDPAAATGTRLAAREVFTAADLEALR